MIILEKERTGLETYAIRLTVIDEAADYHSTLLTLPAVQPLGGGRYVMPYTKEAYGLFVQLKLPFRISTSNSSQISGHTDTTSIGESQNPARTSTESDPSSAAIEKGEDRWKKQTQVEYRSGVFTVSIPYCKDGLVWIKGLQKSYWSPKNKCWIVKATAHNLHQIQETLAVYTTDRYAQVAALVVAADQPKRIELWQSPEDKSVVYLKAVGIDIEPIRRIPGRAYDKLHQRWTIPHDTRLIERLVQYYEERGVKVTSRLKKEGEQYTKVGTSYKDALERLLTKVDTEHRPWLRKYGDTMVAQRYSRASIRQYLGKYLRYLEYYRGRSPLELTAADVNAYLTRLAGTDISDSTLNISISALKYYYTKVEYMPDFHIDRIKRPRRGRHLPGILSQQEVSRLLEVCDNVKHSSILYTLYSSGIRLGELLHLRLEDIYWDRNQVFVRGGKGKKDRVVQLSHTLKEVLRLYFEEYKPIYWLYEGRDKRTQYSRSSVQKVVRSAKRKASIQRKVTPHTLRHCYATHLHDGGTSIRYIQELLGHKDIKTTLIYTHVSTQEVSKIESPLDRLMTDKRKKEE